MKIIIDPKDISIFEEVKNKMLLTDTGLFMILSDYTIEWEDIETTTGFFRKTKHIEKHPVVTACTLWGWNKSTREWGTYADEAISWFLSTKDFSILRRQFVDNIKAPFNALGHDIVHKSKINED